MKVFNREKVKAMGYTDAQIDAYLERVGNKPPEVRTESATAPTRTPTTTQNTNTSTSYPITQTFGQRSKYDVFSGGRNWGVDYAAPAGTPVTLPDGKWKVVDAYAGAPEKGWIGNKANSGYGNSVLVQNEDTGEKLRLSHLSKVAVKTGEKIGGGLIGLSGQSGNTNGNHLDSEYMDANGRKADVLKTPYANLLGGKPNRPMRSGASQLLGR